MEKESKNKRSILIPIVFAVLVIVGLYFGTKAIIHGLHHESTDDAQIATNMAPIVSRVSGYIDKVSVKDNQYVKKGDTLLVLDNRDQIVLLHQAEAALATAKSNVSMAKASATAASKNINTSNAAVATVGAQIEAAKVNVWKTAKDLERYANLVKDHSITQQQYEQALAANQSAEKQLQVLEEQKKQAAQQTNAVSSQSDASYEQIDAADAVVKQREVDLENAKLNLSYTIITAPTDGYVSKVPVQIGQFVMAGAQLFNLINDSDIWVVANFKETQLTKMTEGQKVEIEVDAYPKHKLEGIVSSFSPGTGSSFSLLPPDNASGNFVKVVQRIPVRIDFVNLDSEMAKKLRAGMNVVAEVNL